MGLGGQNIDMVRRRQDAAERWGPRDRDEALSGLGDALGFWIRLWERARCCCGA